MPLGKDVCGTVFDDSWEYPTIVGIIIYLATNSRTRITYVVHQCARFIHNPRESHAVAVKSILR